MPDERAIVRPPAPLTADAHRRASSSNSPWREDAYAVVIGINEYVDQKIPNLRFARADAEAMYDVLIDPDIGRFKPDNVVLLVDSQATERNIRSALGTQLPRRAGADSTVVIYFAGHGAPVVDARAHSADGLEKYLIPHDAVADDLRASGISMDALQQYFAWLDASQVVCFLDSCYSGTAGGRSFDHPSYQTRAMLSDEFLDSLGSEGRFVVTACATNEVSLEDPKCGHGIFTQYLVEGLRGAADTNADGKVTIDELYEYIYKNVERDARLLGGSMNPVKKGSVQGRIYITEYETENKKRVRELLRAASDARTQGNGSAALAFYRDALTLDPANIEATEGATAASAVEQQRTSDVKRRQRLLLGHVNRGDLTMRDYNRALSSLEADAALLDAKDLHYRRLVDALVVGELTVRSFVRSTELLDSETGEHAQPAAVAAPDTSASASAATPSSVMRSPLLSVPEPLVPDSRQSAEPPASRETDDAGRDRSRVLEKTPVPARTSGRSRWIMGVGGIGGLATAAIVYFVSLLGSRVTPVPAPGATDTARRAAESSRDVHTSADSFAAAQAGTVNHATAAAREARIDTSSQSGRSAPTPIVGQRSNSAPPLASTRPPRPPPLDPPTPVPVDGYASLSIDAQLVLRFTGLAPGDEIDRASLAGNITLAGLTSARRTELAVLLGGNGNTVRVTPVGGFAEDTKYILTLQKAIRTKLGRSLQSAAAFTFTSVIVDTLYYYRLINPNFSAIEGLTVDSLCRMEQPHFDRNQVWYFTSSGFSFYYVLHNMFGGPATGLVAGALPGACRLKPVTSPPVGMSWTFGRVPGRDRRYFLQNGQFGRGQSLAVAPNGLVMQATDSTNPQQIWGFLRYGRR